MRITQASRQDFLWLVEKTGCWLTSDFKALKAVDSDGSIRGMVGYCNATPASIQLHMAVDTPIAWRELLSEALKYAFLQGGKRLAIGIIPAGNRAALNFVERVGFAETYRIVNGWDVGEDLVVLELRRENCRWLSGQRKAA